MAGFDHGRTPWSIVLHFRITYDLIARESDMRLAIANRWAEQGYHLGGQKAPRQPLDQSKGQDAPRLRVCSAEVAPATIVPELVL
jgi:hypothetical protein